MNKSVLFPYYSGNIKLTKSLGLISIHKFIDANKNPTKKIEDLICQIRAEKNQEQKKKLKRMLYSFTPSCVIAKGHKRKIDNILKYTGLMQLDFDKVEDIDTAIDLKNWIFEQEECVVSLLSPSNSVKALIRINEPLDKNQYLRLFNGVSKKYSEISYFDQVTKNPVLPLFLSVDKKILHRGFEDAFSWDEEIEIRKENPSMNNEQSIYYPTNLIFNKKTKAEQYFLNKTIQLFENKIKNIVENGHPQVVSACLILGSRSGGGYINLSDAIKLSENLIRQNNYLQKDVENYIKTSVWAISEGYKNPKYY